MNILVTGGAGFIASHVAEAYIAEGHRVWVLDNLSSGKEANVPKGATLIAWDIADARVEDLLRREKITLINHHAAHMDLRESVTDPAFDAKTNIIGLLLLLEAARKAGVGRFIFASTGGAVYGEQEAFPAPESHTARPASPYGVSKLCGEKYLDYYHGAYKMVPQVLRYANVYGPRQNPHGEAGVVAIFTARMMKGEVPVIHGTGKQTRDFVYVKDVQQANILALRNAQPCLFNVGTGKESDVLTVFRHLRDALKFSKDAGHDAAKEGEQMRSCIDPSAIQKAWGWRPTMDLQEGLKTTVDWFQKNGR